VQTTLNTTDHDLAEFAARIARLEAELAETRRVNAAWRALHVRSVLVLHRISLRLEEVLHDGAGPADGVRGSSLPFDAVAARLLGAERRN
jgi:hypothetical protein